ncbi:AI-2E family transporter [uncultured Secundilactobacillus sp.]|uniref:AI-2E family transporter n=1 Tax=uncultured Secundilactobacillus sp. TaxID=2813935 RepID=UPI00258F8F90|nr:AI-2E family transporter [uncultured Secundilactobacillus sp.]
MSLYERFVNNIGVRRWAVLGSIVFALWLLRGEMNMILLTFIFTFLVVRLIRLVQRYVKLPSSLIVVMVYLLVIAAMYFAVTKYIPMIVKQVSMMVQSSYDFYQSSANDTNQTVKLINDWMNQFDIVPQVKSGLKVLVDYVSTIGSFGLTFFLSFILSFFFTVEEKQMATFSQLFLTSHFGWYFQDIAYFAKKFLNTFGVVLEAQFMIAVVNTVITTVGLAILHFPQLLALSIMVFIFSLIPVAGVILSAIPLTILGYSVGGLQTVAYIVIMLIVVHGLEAYVLNPKFMSSKTELPIFYTFVVLLAGEAFWGVWGLLLGVPVFTFFLDVLGVKAAHGLHVPPARFQKMRLKRFYQENSNSDEGKGK